MTLEDEIRAKAKKKGVLPYFIEKEYLQHLFLSQLFKSEGFILRGGSCLRIAYGYERFSRSLELASSLPGEEVKKALQRALKGMTKVDYSVLSERLHEKGYEAMVEFKGPLYYGTSKNTNLLVISVKFRDTLLEPKRLRITSSFGIEYMVWAMDVREILAEKLLSLALKKRPKDAYDVWSILKKGVEPDRSLIGRKASLLGLEFSMPSSPFCDKRDYEKTLRNTLPSLPPYKEVIGDLEVFLSGKKPAVEAPLKKEYAEVAYPQREYRLWLGLVFILGGLFAVAYFIIQEGQKEAFTVLYFSDPENPLHFDRESKDIFVNFTVENHEYADMNYIYKVSIKSDDGGILASRDGRLVLAHGENVSISERLPYKDSLIGGKLYVELYVNNTNTDNPYRTIWQRIE